MKEKTIKNKTNFLWFILTPKKVLCLQTLIGTCNRYQSRKIMTTNKDRIENLDAILGEF